MNVAVFKRMAEKHPHIATVPCFFHGLDGLLGHLLEKVPVLLQTKRMCSRLVRYARQRFVVLILSYSLLLYVVFVVVRLH